MSRSFLAPSEKACCLRTSFVVSKLNAGWGGHREGTSLSPHIPVGTKKEKKYLPIKKKLNVGCFEIEKHFIFSVCKNFLLYCNLS